MKKTTWLMLFATAVVLNAVAVTGCDDDSGSDSDSDGDTDGDSDSDSDSDADSDTDSDADSDADTDADTDADSDADSDADGDYDVIIYSATITGTDWDTFDDADPQLYLNIGASETANTSVITDDVTPLWNETLFTGSIQGLSDSWYIEIYDYDATGDDKIGECTVTVTETQIASGELTIAACDAAEDILFYFDLLGG